MYESKYLSRFINVREKAADKFTLFGNRLLVEMLPKEELKSAGGLILHAPTNDHRTDMEQNRAVLALVLAAGTGYYNEESGNSVPLEVAPGNVVLVSEMGLKKYTQFPGLAEYTANQIALTRETEIHMCWPSVEAYEAYKYALNSHR
jgi:co-chaperonin GroES (HSP10)